MSEYGIVTIGRNEGQRLLRCLDALTPHRAPIVYVDSGSTDGSIDAARVRGIEVVELDLSTPFTAARARNAGLARLLEVAPHLDHVQFLDGDCVMQPHWLETAQAALDADATLAVACGRRRETAGDASIYNRLCDMEWDTPIGNATACGGDAMMRIAALQQVGGYDESFIAGEEPELCVRLRQAGWGIVRLDAEMTLHDAAMTRLGQWWKRAVRAGHAYAEGAALHGRSPQHHNVRQVRSTVAWGLVWPIALTVCLAAAILWTPWALAAAVVLLAAAALLTWRIYHSRRRRAEPRRLAAVYAAFCVLAKAPQAQGVLTYRKNRLLCRRSKLIEYKGPSHGATASRSKPSDLPAVRLDPAVPPTDVPHILYIGAALPSRSETFVYREVLGLRSRGANVSVASVHPPQTQLGDSALDALAEEAIPIYAAGPALLLADAAAQLLTHPMQAGRTLLQGCLDASRADDVRVSRRYKVLWQCLAGLALARRIRSRTIGHLHAHMAHVPTTIAMYAAMASGLPFSFTGHAADLFRDRSLLSVKLKRAAFVACISHWHRRFYADIAPIPEHRLPLVRCGVDVHAFEPRPDADEALAIDILAVGRLVPKKGFDLLVRAVARMAPHRRPRVTIVGDGPERERLLSLCHELGVDDVIDLLGPRDHADVCGLMQSAKLFVLPCRQDRSGDRDGIPVVLMEAMACGVCVLTGDVGAVHELVVDGQTGLVLPPDDVDALATAIERLLNDPDERARLGSAGRARVIDEFSSTINLARLERALLTNPAHDTMIIVPFQGATNTA